MSQGDLEGESTAEQVDVIGAYVARWSVPKFLELRCQSMLHGGSDRACGGAPTHATSPVTHCGHSGHIVRLLAEEGDTEKEALNSPAKAAASSHR